MAELLQGGGKEVSRIASLLRDLADEFDRLEPKPSADPKIEGSPKKRRVYSYKPQRQLTEDEIRAARRRAARRGISM